MKLFVFWRISLFAFAWLGTKILPFKESFPYSESLLKPFGSELFWSWANFDGVHYLGIAQKGYFAQFTQAFFPLYPLLVRYLDILFHNILFTGLSINHLAFFTSLYLLYKLVRIDFGYPEAKWTILYLIFFPTSFFFGSFYTESFFLLLVLAAFYASRLKKWWLAGLFGFLASLTKVIGVLFVPALLWEFYESRKKKDFLNFVAIRNGFFTILPTFGLALYMSYLAKNFSDPLYFLHAQPTFGASRSADKIILLYQVFFRYLRMIFTFGGDRFLYFTINLEFLSALLFLALLLLAYKKNIRVSYIIFAAFAYILPTLTGTFSSMPRYVLVLFPCFIVLASIKKNVLRNFLLCLFYFLLFFCTLLFTRGYWIA